MSVNEAKEQGAGNVKPTRSSVSSPIGLAERNNRVPRSLRYMRNKPQIISLKTPSYEGISTTTTANGNNKTDKERLAEEGMMANCGESSDVFDNEANELHPIMGTTRTGQGSLAVGRPLEVRETFSEFTISSTNSLATSQELKS